MLPKEFAAFEGTGYCLGASPTASFTASAAGEGAVVEASGVEAGDESLERALGELMSMHLLDGSSLIQVDSQDPEPMTDADALASMRADLRDIQNMTVVLAYWLQAIADRRYTNETKMKLEQFVIRAVEVESFLESAVEHSTALDQNNRNATSMNGGLVADFQALKKDADILLGKKSPSSGSAKRSQEAPAQSRKPRRVAKKRPDDGDSE